MRHIRQACGQCVRVLFDYSGEQHLKIGFGSKTQPIASSDLHYEWAHTGVTSCEVFVSSSRDLLYGNECTADSTVVVKHKYSCSYIWYIYYCVNLAYVRHKPRSFYDSLNYRSMNGSCKVHIGMTVWWQSVGFQVFLILCNSKISLPNLLLTITCTRLHDCATIIASAHKPCWSRYWILLFPFLIVQCISILLWDW